MCRHIGYLGEPLSPAEALFHAPHSLLVQSYAPADMRGGGSVNADGFGLGWYPGPGSPPLRHRRSTPLWTDETLPPLAAAVTAGAFVAVVRNGTTGLPVTEAAAEVAVQPQRRRSRLPGLAGRTGQDPAGHRTADAGSTDGLGGALGAAAGPARHG